MVSKFCNFFQNELQLPAAPYTFFDYATMCLSCAVVSPIIGYVSAHIAILLIQNGISEEKRIQVKTVEYAKLIIISKTYLANDDSYAWCVLLVVILTFRHLLLEDCCSSFPSQPRYDLRAYHHILPLLPLPLIPLSPSVLMLTSWKQLYTTEESGNHEEATNLADSLSTAIQKLQ